MTGSSFKTHRCGTWQEFEKRAREREGEKKVHIDDLINTTVQGYTTTQTHIHTRHQHKKHAGAEILKVQKLTTLSSLDAAQCKDVLLISEELPHLVEGFLPPNGELVPRLWSGQDLTD